MTSTATAGTTSAKSTRPAAKHALPASIRTISIGEAIEALHRLDDVAGVIPDAARDTLNDAVTQLRTACTRLDVTNLEQLMTNATTVMQRVTGIATPVTGYHNSEHASRLHIARNTLAALAAAAVGELEAGDLDAVARALPPLKPRTTHLCRALTNDEILLCRIDVASSALRNRAALRAAGVYALCDAGAAPGETTTITLTNLDERTHPKEVLAPGNRNILPRILPLDRFAARLVRALARDATAHHLEDNTPLTYRPRRNAPGSPQATASAQGVIDAILHRWRIADTDTTASSVRLWAIATAYTTGGIDVAKAIAGRADNDAVLRMIHMSTKPSVTELCQIKSFTTALMPPFAAA